MNKRIILVLWALLLAACTSVPISSQTETSIPTLRPINANVPVTATPEIGITPTLTPQAPINVGEFALDHDGFLWAIANGDVVNWNLATGDFQRFAIMEPSERAWDVENAINITSAGDGSIWVITTHGKIKKYVQGTWTDIKDFDAFEPWASITKQADGGLWISMGGQGAYHATGDSMLKLDTPKNFDCGISSIMEGNGELWAIDGVCMKQPTSLRRYDHARWTKIEGYSPWSLAQDRQGNVWFWDGEGNFLRVDQKKKLTLPDRDEFTRLVDIAFAPDNSIWVVDYTNGIFHLVDEKWIKIETGFQEDGFLNIESGDDGFIYVGTNQGRILRFDGTHWTQYVVEP